MALVYAAGLTTPPYTAIACDRAYIVHKCGDDTMPKTVATTGMVESTQQSSATPKKQDVGIGLRKIVACLPVVLFNISTAFGTVSSLHPTSFLFLCGP